MNSTPSLANIFRSTIMKLDDPELLRKSFNPSTHINSKSTVPYVHKSLYCRNGYHHRCHLPSCLCECHDEAAKQLAHQLMEKGAVRVEANSFPLCSTHDCGNRVMKENDLFCLECSSGLVPRARNFDSRPL